MRGLLGVADQEMQVVDALHREDIGLSTGEDSAGEVIVGRGITWVMA